MGSRLNGHPTEMATFSLPRTHTSNSNKMANTQRILGVITDLESQEVPNVKATAEKHNIKRKTLENHWKSRSTLMEESISIHR